MYEMKTLKDALLDLLKILSQKDIPIIVGGGYGIYLWHSELLKLQPRTLLERWPEPRSTNDLDLYLRTELLCDPDRLKPFREALDTLGYKPIDSAQFYQFIKPGPEGGEAGSLKIDVLTGPQSEFKKKGVRVDNRRVHPKPKIGLHAHPTDEAFTLEMNMKMIKLPEDNDAAQSQFEVYLPHPFSFVMMKLFALRDRQNDEAKDYGRHHALDLYTCIALMTEEEWEASKKFKNNFSQNESFKEGSVIANELFASEDSSGILRLKESEYYREDFQVAEFRTILLELVS